MAIKRINIMLQTFYADVEEKQDKYIVKSPMLLQVVPNPQTGQPQAMLVPMDLEKPDIELTVPKDHVYFIEDVRPELVKLYKDILTELKLASKGLVTDSKMADKLGLKDDVKVKHLKIAKDN